VLIDWEYAGPAEPLFDLAVVAEHHRLPAARARILLAAWAGGAGKGDWERLQGLRAAYRDLRRLWSLAAAVAASPGLTPA
jgi:thiamine kinase-like enzyme